MTTRSHAKPLYPPIARDWQGPEPSRVNGLGPVDGPVVWEWDTDLTAPQAAAFDDAIRAARYGLTPAEFADRRADIDGLATYLGIASPTAAQTAAATKAIIRVVRALVRDD